MCYAFSGLVTRQGSVKWKFGMDSHTELVAHFKLKDDEKDPDELKFANFEIRPKKDIRGKKFKEGVSRPDYLHATKREDFGFIVDEELTPIWLGDRHERSCWKAWEEWKAKLDKVLIRKEIINPLELEPPKITDEHILLLKRWDSVRDSAQDSVLDSVRGSVWGSVWGSVRDSVPDLVQDLVWDSVLYSVSDLVGYSIRGSIWDSGHAYIGSFFRLDKWEYVEHKKGEYPFQPVVDLWEQGLVPSFDGTTMRLHGGKKAKVLFEITQDELKKFKGKGGKK